MGRVVSLGLRVVSLSRVSDVSDVSTVTVSNVVGDSLKTSVGKSDAVASLGRVTITRLIGIVVCSTVIVIDSVLVAVHGGLVVGGLVVGRSTVGGDRGSGGSGDTGENNEGLKLIYVKLL